jgi:hypothetical protein
MQQLRISLLLAFTLTAAPAAADERLAAFAGAWLHRGGAEEARAIDRAIEAATAELGWLTRGATRALLRMRVAPARRIDLRWQAGALRIERDGARREPLPLGFPDGPWQGARAAIAPDGSLVVRWHDDLASGMRRYRLHPDGELGVEQELTSERLSAPLRFRTRYRRAGSVTP